MRRKYLILVSITLVIASCSPAFKTKWTEETAPEYFKARFETTKGSFDIEAKREWSPAGVDRLYQLIKRGFYTDIAIFRVVPDFVAQFGISSDSTSNDAWRTIKVIDEPVVKTNTKGTIAFARGGPQTRTTQIFINLKSNSPRLDNLRSAGIIGFPVVAEITSGMDVVETFYDEYGDVLGRRQDSIRMFGNTYLRQNYPEVDYIVKAYILKK